MKLFIVMIGFIYFFSCSAFAQEVVTLSTDGKDDFQVRLEAKNQALINALPSLPSVIWGEESLRDDNYSEHLQSIGYAHADVTILTESFNRQLQTYTLTANVSFDQEAIMSTLSKVSDGQFALSTLNKIREIMGNADLSRFIDTSSQASTPLYKEASLYTNPYFYAQNHADLVLFHDNLISHFASLLAQQSRAYLAQFSVTLTKVNKDYFTYHLKGPKLPTRLILKSPELQSLYDDYAEEINEQAGGICLFTPLGNKFFTPPQSEQALDITFHVNQEFAPLAYPDFLYRNDMRALEFVYCDGPTKAFALDLKVAMSRFLEESVD